MLSSTDGFATGSRTYDTGARRLNQTAMIGDRDGDGRVLDDRGTGRAHVGALAAAGPRRGGRRLRVTVPLGPSHGALRRSQAPVARHLGVADKIGRASCRERG